MQHLVSEATRRPPKPEAATGPHPDEQVPDPLGIAYAAHDLRGPLRQVMDLAAVAAETEDAEARNALLEDARGVAARCVLLLDRLLDLAVGRGALASAAPLSMRSAALAAARHHQGAVERAGATLCVRGEARLRGDGVLLEQLFRNLIGNALAYSGEAPPRIDVRLSVRSGRARAVVCDHGTGIPPERRRAVFAPYVRQGGQVAGRGRGHGLGLALCRQVAEAHGGTIWAAPPRGTEATRIVLDLPGLPPRGPAGGSVGGTESPLDRPATN